MKTWNEVAGPVLNSPEMLGFKQWLKSERETKKIYPEPKDTLRAFDLCPYKNVKVVLFGQDPYHSPGTADGLAFSTRQSKRPYSLNNIMKEIYTDLNIQYFHNKSMDEFFPTNNLENWAKSGFLLLNTVLTVEEGKASSHKGKGWERLLSAVIDALNAHENRLIFLLWGNSAHELENYIDDKKHLIFKAAHPAAEAHKENAGFFGCKHFSIIRDVLPTIHKSPANSGIILNSCFDRKKAAEIIQKEYPKEAERLIRYMEKEMMINVPVNESAYTKELRKFEESLSTIIKHEN